MDRSCDALGSKSSDCSVWAVGSSARAAGHADLNVRLSASREGERQYFDSLILRDGDFNPFTDAGWSSLRRAFDRIIDGVAAPRQFADVLDVGCGTGRSLQLYANRATHYVGVDLSGAAIAVAKAKFPDRRWMIADATRLPFDEGGFDLVAFSSVLHHLPDYPVALREAFRVLRPGGWVFAYDPNLLHPAMALFRWRSSPFYSPKGVSPNESPLRPGKLRGQFRSAGFDEIRQSRLAGLSFLAIEPVLLRPFLRLYNIIDRSLAVAGLWRWFGAFVLTAGRKPMDSCQQSFNAG